jgi:stage IV sporulation protein A
MKLKRGKNMADSNIYKDIETRTGGDIYIGVVGPVRTGKSTFIKKFMDVLVLPNIKEQYIKERATDELPQSSTGRTIMTTEPKFIPENAVNITLDDSAHLSVRLIDCVGYIVPSSLGYIEEDNPRMVMTPWYTEEVPFNMAAEIGTKKVINEHSSIGLVVTTDGSIGDIPRAEYAEAEKRVIDELKAINKPFIVLLNCKNPRSEQACEMANRLSRDYLVPVMPVNCLELDENDIKAILKKILYQFPVKEVCIQLPGWINALPLEHWLRESLNDTVMTAFEGISKIKDLFVLEKALKDNKNAKSVQMEGVNLGTGKAEYSITVDRGLFYSVITENLPIKIEDDRDLMEVLAELSAVKEEYMRVKNALDEVEATGYGIVMPTTEELSLEEPEIMHQGGRYGVRLRASAPSIHMMKANITTEVSPIVGSEKQSEDLIKYLLSEFEDDPTKIWSSNIFGKSLHELVNEGLNTKLARMPGDARMRIQETVERVINEGCNGLVCIII